ncbi:beta-ketoacyl-[acyl-carrier-protein] synthase family protein [Colwellia sp. 12G3]|uniref:beta-ketoacyl-[acyl-carrier-protein] synthase family protein n=1 Tax=Colwellia sp. 12G3 TaxID=2058299 RepID=UPI000C342782|nr:beta-ketoacyl-[acyl-carrier-protein] synthase family protein [Colwellia sp. 12G3]PKI13869.1 beta-ketoacyl-[acyl-carrier-protein] synthase II [Colwellia sp. 12G3]
MKETLYINDFALVNALGSDKETIKSKLLAGSQSGLSCVENLLLEGPITVADVTESLPDLSDKPKHLQSRNNQLAALALNQIKAQAQALIERLGADRVAIIVGTSTSGISEGEQAMQVLQQQGEFPEHYDYRQQEIYNLAEFISEELATTGICLTISTACSSSAKAFKTASEIIDAGMADAAIVGGVDTLCGMTVNGFYALNSTASGTCQPSSANRDGINIGEAAALAILTKDEASSSHSVRLLGVGESSDAHHMSAPHPEGEGAIVAMQSALAEAGIKASDVDYINLHGTATPKNDAMEAAAVAHVFGKEIPCSSSKGLIGHTLGAAGATEVGLCWLLLCQEGDDEGNYSYAPQVWDHVIDESMPALKLVAIGDKKTSPIRCCLSNSFAFGGNNVSVLIGR